MAVVVQLRSTAQVKPDPAGKWSGHGMAVIAVASTHAGSGKTTLAAHLAVRAAHAGHGPVAMLDMGRGHALHAWAARRANPAPVVVRAFPGKLAAGLVSVAKFNFPLCFIDAAGFDFLTLRETIAAADLVVIPCPLDRDSLAVADALREKIICCGGHALIIANAVPEGDEIDNQETHELVSYGRLCPVGLQRDSAVDAAMKLGRTVTETEEGGSAAREIGNIWPYVRAWLDDGIARPKAEKLKKIWRPAMRVITVVSKTAGGNAGLSMHLAVQAVRAGGRPVAILNVDGEMDCPLDRWCRARNDDSLHYVRLDPDDIGAMVEEVRNRETGLCLIDADFHHLDTLTAEPAIADLLVVPASPIEILRDGELASYTSLASRKDVAFLLTRSGDNRRLMRDASEALSLAGGHILGKIHFDDHFLLTLTDGVTVMESRHESRAAREMVELWSALRKLLAAK